uniref:Putative conserved secreted protein n=1 Tax=Culex tarsalis TaxID=7177 RepID=A0A1Q3FSR5_CULTA
MSISRIVLVVYAALFVTGSLCNDPPGDGMHPALGRLLQSVQGACNAESGDGFQKLAESMQKIYQCPAVVEIMQQLQDKNPGDSFNNCSPERMLPCYDPVIDSINRCLTRESADNRRVLQEMVREVLVLGCKNRTTAADPKVFYPCIDQIDSIVDDCKAPFVNPSVPISGLNESECSELEKSKSCILEKLTACGADLTIPGISAMYSAIRSANQCVQSNESDDSES